VADPANGAVEMGHERLVVSVDKRELRYADSRKGYGWPMARATPRA
jgi:hypothetical protein